MGTPQEELENIIKELIPSYIVNRELEVTRYVAKLQTLMDEARERIPDDIKGIMVSGVPTLHDEMDKISLQDLRLLIAQLREQS